MQNISMVCAQSRRAGEIKVCIALHLPSKSRTVMTPQGIVFMNSSVPDISE